MVRQRIHTSVRIFVAFVMALTVLFANTHSVNAVDSSANTLKISPVRSDVEVKAGESTTVTVVVTNLTSQDIYVKALANDFVAGDEEGAPALILDADEYAPSHSLKRFMSGLQDVTIPANKSATVDVVLTVPKDADAGGYFGAVRFAPTTGTDGGQVNLDASVASIILLTVPGDLVETMNLTNFSIQQNKKAGTFFTSPKDIEASFRFENKGNVQLAPFGKISVKKGNEVIYTYDFNQDSPREVVLPDSARRWNIGLNNIGDFGYYTVSATLTYGTKNQTVEVTKSFWVIPWSLIIGSVVGLVALIGLIVGARFFLKGYKRRIENQSNSGFRR
ncbi:MAG: DUF916 domain-containing protein [Candidatus Saccharimonas sp.]